MSVLAGQTALVTGATGFLGGALARRLAADGVCVKALARREGRDSYISNVENIEIVSGNLTDADRMLEIVQGCDYVFHVAAAIRGKLDYQREVNVTGTANVARAAASAHVKRLIHVSTIAVYGYQYNGIITEDTAHRPGNVPYNTSKSEAETILRRIAHETGLSYSINRPGMIYGQRSGMWTDTIFKFAKRRPVPFVNDGSGKGYPIFIDDVVDMLILQATHPAADGEAFNCVYQPQPTVREFVGKYMALVDNDSWRTYPTRLVKFIAPLVDAILHYRGEPQDVQDLLRLLERDVIYSMDKADRLLNWQPQVSLDEGIQRTIPYLQEIGLL
jgi:nucleoside-diphosphate-sugar epimerase